MKCVVVCLALCVVVMAQDQVLTTTHLPHTGSHVNTLEHLIRQEVHDILAADTDHKMNVVACSEKCDAEFALISSHAEGVTTHMCHMECDRAIRHRHQAASTI